MGKRIKHARQMLEVRQNVLAKAVGKTPGWLSQVEADLIVPHDADVIKIADFLGVFPTVFTEPPKPKRRRLEHL